MSLNQIGAIPAPESRSVTLHNFAENGEHLFSYRKSGHHAERGKVIDRGQAINDHTLLLRSVIKVK